MHLLGICLVKTNNGISKQTFRTLRNLDICIFPATLRGTRAGRKTIHKISTCFVQRVPPVNTSVRVVNPNNCVQIKCNAFNDSGLHLSNFACLNAQSVRNKTHLLKDYILDRSIQFCAITESWLKPNRGIEMGELKPSGYKLHLIHRLHNKAGGIVVVHKESLKAEVKDKGSKQSYQYMDILVPHGSDSVRLLVLCRPPYNTKTNPVPISRFFEEFSSHMESFMLSPHPILITGDFNVHMDMLNVPDSLILKDSERQSKQEASKFDDLLSSFGLHQHVFGPTHRSGHTLDLIITRSDNVVLRGSPVVDSYVSDHWSLLFKVCIRRPAPLVKQVSFRKIKTVDINAFKDVLHRYRSLSIYV